MKAHKEFTPNLLHPIHPDDVARFIFGARPGRSAIFSVISKATNTKFTFKFKTPAPKAGDKPRNPENPNPCRFVFVQTGGEERARWAYLGYILNHDQYGIPAGTLAHARRSGKCTIPRTDTVVKAADWIARHATEGTVPGPDVVGVFHCDRCSHCGLRLTDDVSKAQGLGPDCATNLGRKEERQEIREGLKAAGLLGAVRCKGDDVHQQAEDDLVRRRTMRDIGASGAQGLSANDLDPVQLQHARDLVEAGVCQTNHTGDRFFAFAPSMFVERYGPAALDADNATRGDVAAAVDRREAALLADRRDPDGQTSFHAFLTKYTG